jgi:branched-chain amino acid transport system substrate-binding protein
VLLDIGKSAVEGNYFSTHYSAENGAEKTKKFVADYQARYNGKTPDAMAALGYDSAMMLFDGMTRAATTDGPKVRDALAATKDFEGATGHIKMNEHRDAVKAAVILQIKDGKFHFVESIAP